MSWCSINILSCNAKETEIIHLTSRFLHFTALDCITKDEEEIKFSDRLRNLDVVLDRQLDYKANISEVIRQDTHALSLLSML